MYILSHPYQNTFYLIARFLIRLLSYNWYKSWTWNHVFTGCCTKEQGKDSDTEWTVHHFYRIMFICKVHTNFKRRRGIGQEWRNMAIAKRTERYHWPLEQIEITSGAFTAMKICLLALYSNSLLTGWMFLCGRTGWYFLSLCTNTLKRRAGRTEISNTKSREKERKCESEKEKRDQRDLRVFRISETRWIYVNSRTRMWLFRVRLVPRTRKTNNVCSNVGESRKL